MVKKIFFCVIENVLLYFVTIAAACILADLKSEISSEEVCMIIGVLAVLAAVFLHICKFWKNILKNISSKYVKPSIIVLTIYWLILLTMLLGGFNTDDYVFALCSALMFIGFITAVKRVKYYYKTFEKYCPWIEIPYRNINIFNYQRKIDYFVKELDQIKDSDISEIIKDAFMSQYSIIPIYVLYFENVYLTFIIMLFENVYLTFII